MTRLQNTLAKDSRGGSNVIQLPTSSASSAVSTSLPSSQSRPARFQERKPNESRREIRDRLDVLTVGEVWWISDDHDIAPAHLHALLYYYSKVMSKKFLARKSRLGMVVKRLS